jgi:hypothetical protein
LTTLALSLALPLLTLETAALTGGLSLLASLGLALSLLSLRTILTALPLALSSLALGTLP